MGGGGWLENFGCMVFGWYEGKISRCWQGTKEGLQKIDCKRGGGGVIRVRHSLRPPTQVLKY